MTSQRFCLRWNNHQSNLLSVFDQLLQDESFVDVTLAVDGRNLKAHKIVLSACSPYFQALFVGHPDRHPIVILKDIPYVDMRSLLDFMYRGEVSVDQDRLTMFLKVAESLRIKGLTETSGDNCDNLSKMSSSLSSAVHHSHHTTSMSYQQRLKRPLSVSQHSLNSLQSTNPLLGSALTGPKRKRGLPRKLSGSLSSGLDMMPDMDETEMRDEEDEFDDDRSVASDSDMMERDHSPFEVNKMLEVNVSEGKAPGGPARPPSSTGADDSSSVHNMDERGEGGSPSPERKENADEVEEKEKSQDLASNVKMERDSDAPSSGDQNERNSSPGAERFPPGLLRLIPRSELVSKEKLDSVGLLKVNGQRNGRPSQSEANLNLLKSLIMNNNVEETDENGRLLAQFTSEHKFILSQLEQFQKNTNANAKDLFANNFSLHAQSQHIHQMLTNNNGTDHASNENHNFLAPNNGGSSPTQVKRRIRRRATSSSDPTESLTEMSVRGLNLFRYASVTEGIYKCMECAKVDVVKTFKNKYSFQRHAFLYHEGCQRKVFPCPICGKEFSRPDKMKNHMKTVHDCFMPATSPQVRRHYQRPERPQPRLLPESLSTALSLVHRSKPSLVPIPPSLSSIQQSGPHQWPNRTLTKSITYELNADVSLTRGIIYDPLDVKDEDDTNVETCEQPNRGDSMLALERKQEDDGFLEEPLSKIVDNGALPVGKNRKRLPKVEKKEDATGDVEVKVEVEEETPPPEKRRRSRRMMKLAEQDYTEVAEIVECADVLKSLTNTRLMTQGEQNSYPEEQEAFGSGVHFLTSESLLSLIQTSDQDEDSNSSYSIPTHEEDILTRKDLLEYMMKKDGSCVCKLCGQILTSRTHWYRHKYKVHTPAHLSTPTAPPQELHTCKQCNQYFKSKKGYLGHVHAKHNADYEAEVAAQILVTPASRGDTAPSSGEEKLTAVESRMTWIREEKDQARVREMEDQLVKDIIAKVREECEKEGDGMLRRGYTKKMRK